MAVAEAIVPPTDLDFDGGEAEHWTGVFGFEGLFDESERLAIDGLLVTRRINIINLGDDEDPSSNAIVFELDGSIDVVVFDAAEAMRPVIGHLVRPLLRVYFFSHSEAEKNLARDEDLQGHNFTEAVISYLGRSSYEG